MTDMVCGDCEHWGVRSCQFYKIPMCATLNMDKWGKLTAKTDCTQCWVYSPKDKNKIVGGLEQPPLTGLEGF